MPSGCSGVFATIVDADGTHAVQNNILFSPSGVAFGMTTGFVGNVSRSSFPNDAPTDFLHVYDSANTLFTQTHATNVAANGWFTAEAFAWNCPSWSAGAHYAVQNVQSIDDVVIAPPLQAPNVICYIDGIRGDWSRVRSNGSGGSIQPYAQIYTDPGGAIHLKVRPIELDPMGDGVSAYASCLFVN